MGLYFTAGNPADVFVEAFGETVRRTLESHFGGQFVFDSSDPPYTSEEVGWSGWRQLQDRARGLIPEEKIAHFLSMEAWQGVYVPVETDIGVFTFDGHSTPLSVASLDHLLGELEAIGVALGLPTDGADMQSLFLGYRDDDDRCDDDMDIQTYVQLLLSAREAKKRNQPLWVVK
jgi:hypothetical protein